VVGATPSFATSLLPGGTTTSISTEGGWFTVLANTGAESFSFGGAGNNADQGTVQELVGNFAGNPYGPGDISLVFDFTVTKGNVGALTAGSLAGLLVDVGMNALCVLSQCQYGTGTVAPSSVARTADGTDVTFSFVPEVTGGQNSYFLIINTNGDNFTASTFGMIDNGGETMAGYTAIPEPASLSLLGTGLLALGAGLRRKLLT